MQTSLRFFYASIFFLFLMFIMEWIYKGSTIDIQIHDTYYVTYISQCPLILALLHLLISGFYLVWNKLGLLIVSAKVKATHWIGSIILALILIGLCVYHLKALGDITKTITANSTLILGIMLYFIIHLIFILIVLISSFRKE